jgi:hypothetical protein
MRKCHIKCFCLDLFPESLGEEAAASGVCFFKEGLASQIVSLPSVLWELKPDYRNTATLGFALKMPQESEAGAIL